MRIIVVGNVASGKSTIAIKLAQALKMRHVGIDFYRRQFGNGTVMGENQAKKAFLNRFANKGGVFELMGSGQLAYYLFERINYLAEMPLIVLVNTPKTECLERYEARPPFKFKVPQFWSSALEIIDQYNINEVANFFAVCPQITINNGSSTALQYSLNQILDYLHNEQRD